MCVDDGRDFVLVGNAGDEFVDDNRSLRVEARVRFVAEEVFGFEGNGTCDGDALLHTAGEFGGQFLVRPSQIDTCQAMLRAFDAIFVGFVGEHIEGEHDVLEHGERVEEGCALENHAHLSAQHDALLLGERDKVAAVVEDVAAGGREQPHDVLDEDGLSAARLPDDEVHLAVLEGGVDVLEDFLVVERLIKMLDFDHGVSGENLCEENVGKEHEDAAGDDGVGRGLAHLHGAAFDGVALVGRHAGDDEGIDYSLNHAAPEEPLVELVAEALVEFGHGGGAHETGGIGAHDAGKDAQGDEHGHDGQHAQNLGQDKVARGVDTHDVEGVNLLRDAHGAQFRRDVRPDLSCQNQAHDARRKLQQHDFARRIAHHHPRHPRTLDVQLDLQTDDGTDEERDDEHQADAVVAQLEHLGDVLLVEHTPTVGLHEHPTHQLDVASQMCKT